MNSFSQASRLIPFDRLQRLLVLLFAGLLILLTTACSPSDTTASQMDVPEATPADVQRAKGNLSDEATDVDVLSQQGPSQARRSDSSSIQ